MNTIAMIQFILGHPKVCTYIDTYLLMRYLLKTKTSAIWKRLNWSVYGVMADQIYKGPV